MVVPQDGWGDFGQVQRHFLADMEVAVGSEAFRQFWTSSLPFEEAFTQATGMELLEWTHAWARRNIGPVKGGPMPTLATAGMASLLVLLGLGIGVVRANKK